MEERMSLVKEEGVSSFRVSAFHAFGVPYKVGN